MTNFLSCVIIKLSYHKGVFTLQQYDITGMSCAACSARVEKAVSAVRGVSSCNVSLLTNSMAVEGTAAPSAIISAVEHAGYGASVKGASSEPDSQHLENQKEIRTLRNRLIASLCLLLPLMYVSMGHMMWNFPLPAWFEGNHTAMGLLQLLLSAMIMIINQKFFISGIRGLLHKAPNMDTLVAMGSGVSFLWSTVMLFDMTKAVLENNPEQVIQDMHGFYFESAGMILTLITVGKLLEARSKGKTTDALKSLMHLSPKTAVIEQDGKEMTVPVEQVKVNTVFLIHPGGQIPVDGIVLEGQSTADESSLTGESLPVDKNPGDNVSAGTLNQSGFLKCQAVRVGEDTTLSQIIRMVGDAAATKAPIARIADKISGIFVPAVMSISLITLFLWLIAGKEIGYALARAISVLVISCPCALGLATPVSIMVGNGVGAKNGILFKTAVSLEETGNIQIIALDKTGTVTSGQPEVTEILPAEDNNLLLETAYALEKKSEHPLARAVVRYAEEHQIPVQEISDFQAVTGNGLTAVLNGRKICGGNLNFLRSGTAISPEWIQKADTLARNGKTPLYFSADGTLLGIVAVADSIKPDSAEAVRELEEMGIQVVMLTGDNEHTAKAIGAQAGIRNVIAEVLPDGKAAVIQELKKQGKTAMVGDGINDAPALTSADTGIAIGAGTDVAIDAADIVLMKNSLKDAAAAIRLSRRTLKNIHENLFWAFLYNTIGIPLAAGLFIPLTGWELHPMFGAAAMSLSSFCVVTNALRLNLLNIHENQHDKKFKNALSSLDMQKIPVKKPLPDYIMKIEGMMCPHCEATVRKVLEAFPEVDSVTASHAQNQAVIHLQSELLHLEEMKQAVAEQGYTVPD